MNITIIIPTYNEGESIGKLIPAVFDELKSINNHNWSLLIVDGKSKDNTVSIVEEKKLTYPAIHIISQTEKNGLGNAYVLGMNYAIDILKADAFMEFDGDFQHNPKDIHKLVKALDNGYDYIIGSRYIPGGTIPIEWPWYRKFLSNFGNIIIKYGLRIPTQDNTSGFKLTRVSGFRENMPLQKGELLSQRHAYKIHFLHSMITAGAKTIEVPIQFLNRHKGVSKSTIEDIFESLKVVFLLNFKKDKTRINKVTTDR